MKEIDYYNYEIEFIRLEVTKQLVQKLNLPYDTTETLFKNSTTYQLLKKFKLDIWSPLTETYAKKIELVLNTYFQEQSLTKDLEQTSKLSLEQIKVLKETALIYQISLDEAYYLMQIKSQSKKRYHTLKP